MSVQIKKSTFTPDSRNLGGRKFVVEQHFNHRNSLANIKSVLNIQEILCNPPPIKGSNLNKPLYKKINEFHEVYETFRRVACVKQGFSNSLQPPDTFHMIRPVQKIKSKNKAEKQADYQHYLNCNSMAKKIIEINNDPNNLEKLIGGTSYSFYRPKTPTSQFKSHQHFHSQQNLTKKQKIQPIKKKINHNKKKINKNNQNQQYQIQNQNESDDSQNYLNDEEKVWKEIFDNVPINEELNQESLEITKAEIVDVILKYRLYREQDFENLQQLVQFKNSHIDVEILDSIFQEIKDAFNE